VRVAVTGGSGFIGSHLVDALVEAGHDVVVVDQRPPHRTDVTFERVDVTSLPGLVRAFRRCDALFHLAAVANVNEALAHPVETLDVNITGTGRVWEAARVNGVPRAVLASTVWVYAGAPPGDHPLTEDSPVELTATGHLYTSSKIAAELVVHNYLELYGQHFTILRYGIPYGPRMRDELVIPRFVRMALDSETIVISGDGRQYRNYVYIDDLVDAHLLALTAEGEDQVFNLEGPEPVSIRRITEALGGALGRRLAVEFGPARPGDYAGRSVSAAKAARVLGWSPTTRFDEGLRHYVDWYRLQLEDGLAASGS